jgi:hypothetical protein
MPGLLAETTRAAKAYYAQTSDFPLTATVFLTGSPPSPASCAIASKTVATTLRPFMAERLSAAAFTLWQQHGEFNDDLPAHSVSH